MLRNVARVARPLAVRSLAPAVSYFPLPHPLLLFRRSGTYEQLVVPNLQMTSFELGHCMVTKKYTLARKQLHLCTLCFLFALLLGTHSFFRNTFTLALLIPMVIS